MQIIPNIYQRENKQWKYNTYVCETEEDWGQFWNLFDELKTLEFKQLMNRKCTTGKWLSTVVKLFGFFKSYPDKFQAVSCNNTEHPFQFYDIQRR